ncbi:hypothetical protein ASF10_02580 [Flavobacterium sp. Leaf82]|uniref:hypothetical protein n=1 Tax=Flavobacterium sp. Leaf82 TaxID=1736238 RepID=UPI0007010115|nr:hypothetical protein [Flavobacterium sp. Leaf82]KQO34617.1 hypothetical protein ASF10_02580 [Flavobacterium sp. Leaf82]
MFKNFNDFSNYSNFTKDDDLGQYTSYAAYNSDLLRLVDFYGRTPFDWYRNKITGEIIWLDGKAEIDHYSNLGHSWGKTFGNGNRILLDGETKKIYYNGEVLYNLKKTKASFFNGGTAFSDGGSFQNPGALPKGGRNVTWIDFGGAFEALIIILGFEVKGNKPKGKGTNGGKPTKEDKAEDLVNATDNAANAAKTIKDGMNQQSAKKEKKVNSSEYITEYNPQTEMYTQTRRDIYEAQQKSKKKK